MKINPPKTATPVKEKGEDEAQDLPRDKVSIEAFITEWAAMANTFSEDSQSLFAALTSNEPRLTSGGAILHTIDNKVQETLINDRKTEILNQLWKRLNNYFLTLELTIAESTNQQKAYHPQDKLQQMIQKNPAVLDLCKNLDLDFNY